MKNLFSRFATSRAPKAGWSKYTPSTLSQDMLGFLTGLYHGRDMTVPASLLHWDRKDTRSYNLAYNAVKGTK